MRPNNTATGIDEYPRNNRMPYARANRSPRDLFGQECSTLFRRNWSVEEREIETFRRQKSTSGAGEPLRWGWGGSSLVPLSTLGDLLINVHQGFAEREDGDEGGRLDHSFVARPRPFPRPEEVRRTKCGHARRR